MKTTFPKRSKAYQEEIQAIADIVTQIGKDKIAYVILFGSFARGDFYETEIKEESDGTYLKYISDYDFLVITKRYDDATGSRGRNLERKINEKIEKKRLIGQRPFSIILEPLRRVNKELRKGHYFFIDIKKEGILLYKDEKAQELKEQKELTNAERKELSEAFYEEWMENAGDFLFNFYNLFKVEKYKNSAFQLHQATESLYCCSHLVFTNYRPKIHDIEKLNKPLSHYSEEFSTIFPTSTKKEKECFDLLKRAYVEARYNKDYSINKEQLEYLIQRVEKLKTLTQAVCLKKIKSFK